MQETQILSTPSPAATATPKRALVFDACHAGVVLRAVLFVEAVAGVGAMFATETPAQWLAVLALLTGGVLPATLAWLLVACSLKVWLQRLSIAQQYTAGVLLGTLAGLLACALLALVLADNPPWLACAAAGALLSALLVAGLILRARARAPATTTARLAELQARIRPHFLFNTLNTAIALVREEPAKAELVLEDLSDLFRHALAERDDSSTVGQEIELARRYLEIEQVRFGPRLRVEWSLDERVNAARLPPLILQPLVENAVKHGVEPSASGAQVRISTQLRGQVALIKVTNTVPAGQGQAGHGIALANVRDRLRLLHDLQGGFRTALAGNVYQARIEVPMPARGER